MPGKVPTFYWDACVFIAFLKGDKEADRIRDGVRYWTLKAIAGEANLITSTITLVEVLRFRHATRYKDFLDFLQRYVQKRAADHRVCARAHEIRDHFESLAAADYERRLALKREEIAATRRAAGKGDPNRIGTPSIPHPQRMSVPDSIHLATASMYPCDAFHTFDGSGERQVGRFLKLIPLSGHIPRFHIPIRLPDKPGADVIDMFHQT